MPRGATRLGGPEGLPRVPVPTWMSVSGVTTSARHSMGPIRKGQCWENAWKGGKGGGQEGPVGSGVPQRGPGVWGCPSGGSHLPEALLGHGAEAQDLPDDGHALQDVLGGCGDTCGTTA